ncbi:MAG: hypothetical protein R2834_00860 [Rhodothermales bacterium]
MQSILLSGVASGVLVTLMANIPVVGGCLCCLAYIGAGVMSTWHYTNTNELTIAGGTGAGMGALTGLIASIVSSILGFISSKLGLTPTMEEAFRQLEESGQMPPEQLDVIMGLVDNPMFYVGILFVGMIVGAVLGTAGGAIGASAFKKGGAFPNE